MRSNKQISALILALCAVLKEHTSINYISINTCRIFSEGQTIVELKGKTRKPPCLESCFKPVSSNMLFARYKYKEGLSRPLN